MIAADLVPAALTPWRSGRRLARTAEPGDGTLLRRYAGDWRSILDGTSIGLLQLMYPPLGAAVAAQSGFFEDPYGRIYRSIPQIWATILAPDSEVRARQIRDLHRDIRGVASGHRFSALDPETFWWAHATFTHLIVRSVQRYYRPGELDAAGYEHLYADTVSWYERYGVTMRPVPATLAEFNETLERYCAERLEVTPAVQRLVDTGDGAGPTTTAGTALERLTAPILRRWGRLSTIGNLPPVARARLGVAWTADDEARLEHLTVALRSTFEAMPPAINRATFIAALRHTGSRTRAQRYRPESGPPDVGSRGVPRSGLRRMSRRVDGSPTCQPGRWPEGRV